MTNRDFFPYDSERMRGPPVGASDSYRGTDYEREPPMAGSQAHPDRAEDANPTSQAQRVTALCNGSREALRTCCGEPSLLKYEDVRAACDKRGF